MTIRAEDSGIVETEVKELPVLAVHVLERLGYRVNRHSKRVGEIIAGLQVNEQIGRDWFRSDYQVVLGFKKGQRRRMPGECRGAGEDRRRDNE